MNQPEQPPKGAPGRPLAPSRTGDTWVYSPEGERYWGRFGAAGLLAVDAERGVLLQHRVSWSHHGGTWGIPGGALHENEPAVIGALREAEEEADSPPDSLAPRLTSVLDLGFWSYTTVIADVTKSFEPYISDYESQALEWVPIDEIDELPLCRLMAGAARAGAEASIARRRCCQRGWRAPRRLVEGSPGRCRPPA